MAVYGVLGDIHGNSDALAAVLAFFDRRGADGLVCVGDIVGYNADPDECAARLRERRALAVAGNHDLIGIGQLGFRRCSNEATYSLRRTRRSLAPETVAYLRSLPRRRILEDRVLLVHGGIRDVERYLVNARDVARDARVLHAEFPGVRVCLFGHTHAQRVYEIAGEEVRALPFDAPVFLREDRTYFVNPGSVDAARKTLHKVAECALFDSRTWRFEFFRLPYDDAAAEAKAAARGYRIDPLTDRIYSMRRKLLGAP
jgi:predicted phosphodiesterase